MPEIYRFQGIKIFVYYRDHAPPHVHAEHNGSWAVVAIDDARVLESDLPRHTLALVTAWVRAHRAALQTAWDRAERGEAPGRIGPSRKQHGKRKRQTGRRRR